MTVIADEFGPAISGVTIRTAVLSLLQTPPAGCTYPLIVAYLAKVERDAGLTARTLDWPATFRGGMDFTVWRNDEAPVIIAVSKPTGTPEFAAPGVYGWRFETQLAAIVRAEDQDTARDHADLYGAALALFIAQNGGLGANPYNSTTTLAVDSALTTYVTPEFAVDADTSRMLVRGGIVFESLIMPVVQWGGPSVFPTDPYATPGTWPTVTDVNVTVTAVPAGDV